MHEQSYHVHTVLEQYDERTKTFLAFKNTPVNALGRSPVVKEKKLATMARWCGGEIIGFSSPAPAPDLLFP